MYIMYIYICIYCICAACMFIYMYLYMYNMCIYIYIYIYMYDMYITCIPLLCKLKNCRTIQQKSPSGSWTEVMNSYICSTGW